MRLVTRYFQRHWWVIWLGLVAAWLVAIDHDAQRIDVEAHRSDPNRPSILAAPQLYCPSGAPHRVACDGEVVELPCRTCIRILDDHDPDHVIFRVCEGDYYGWIAWCSAAEIAGEGR